MMTPILEEFGNTFNNIVLGTPSKPIVSTVTGTWLKDDEATSAAYWVRHVQATVRFSDALVFLEEELNPVFLERSEEHTSELQSLMRISYAVFCLKKKQTQQSRVI